MKNNVTVIKVGGAVVEDAAALDGLLSRFVRVEGPKILVHGGGRTATAIASRLGLKTQMIAGRRVTDSDMLEVVTMVYGGLVNKRIVAALEARGECALGITGADCGVIIAHRRHATPVDYGFVGDIDRVDAERLMTILDAGITPVIAPLSFDGHTTLLNTNADTIAASTARALAALCDVTLVYCFEKAGVLTNPDDESTVIPEIHRADFRGLVDAGTISGGMIPKIENALGAVEAGVKRVVITSASSLALDSGTTILP